MTFVKEEVIITQKKTYICVTYIPFDNTTTLFFIICSEFFVNLKFAIG